MRGTPFSWAFQATWLAHFLTLPLLVAIYTLFLVVLPVWDTVKASQGECCFNPENLWPSRHA